jgi:hypothetical protein
MCGRVLSSVACLRLAIVRASHELATSGLQSLSDDDQVRSAFAENGLVAAVSESGWVRAGGRWLAGSDMDLTRIVGLRGSKSKRS